MPERVKYLILVPDGALHRVPFDVLRLPDGRFVFERYATSVAPSAAVARALLGGQRRAGAGIVAIGGAAYAASVTAEGPALPPLPDAAREVAMVARLGTAATVLRGPQATIAAFAAAVRQPHLLLHIATHARADEYGTGDGALVLSADSANNGMLSATQLLDMGIEADLVVLSACRSGVGPLLRGEGMQALTAPFLAGGTRSLLATMWLVGDRSTVPLITDFYTQLAAGYPVDGPDRTGCSTIEQPALASRGRGGVACSCRLADVPTTRGELASAAVMSDCQTKFLAGSEHRSERVGER
jgi:CHAT domain-containing protein